MTYQTILLHPEPRSEMVIKIHVAFEEDSICNENVSIIF